MLVKLNGTNAGYYNYDLEKSPINQDQDFLRTEINLDILHGCGQACPGCFIPRKNLTSTDHLATLYELLVNGSFYPDEINVGPTDIFDAANFYELMQHPSMKKLYSISSVGYTTTLLQDIYLIKEKHKIIWDLYDGVDRIPDIDFKIVLDIDKYLDNKLYDWCEKLELFKESSVQFRVNYYKGIFDRISYNELCERVFKDFNAPIVITPSFLTDKNTSGKVEQYLKLFREDLLAQNIDEKWKNLYTFFDAKFNGFGCQNYSFYNGKLYLNPFLYDAIIQRTPEFETNIDEPVLHINMKHAQDLEDCKNCEFILSCAERNIHMYMKSRKLTSCVGLKEYMYANH